MPKSPVIPVKKEEAKPSIHNDVKAEAGQSARKPLHDIPPVPSPAQEATISLYDIPLAPSALSASSAPPAVPANPAPSPPEIYDLTGSDDDDAMVIDINNSSSQANNHNGDFHDEDAETVYHSGGDDDYDTDMDSDSEVSSLDEAPPARRRRRLPPTASHIQEFINQNNYGKYCFFSVRGLLLWAHSLYSTIHSYHVIAFLSHSKSQTGP